MAASLQRTLFGKTAQGVPVELFTLSNTAGMRLKLTNYGATLIAVEVPDHQGKFDNVALDLEKLEDYLRGHPCLGSTIGRYANRIAHARFRLDGKEYRLTPNEGENHLHGGAYGFDKVLWQFEPFEKDIVLGVTFTYVSPDGEEGYPGRLTAKVSYGLTDEMELFMESEAECDKPTVVNLTNHAYWNLADGGGGNVLEHELTINAEFYLPVGKDLIPCGTPLPVAGTPFDFRRPKPIGEGMAALGGGFDHCYVLNKSADAPSELTFAASLWEPKSKRLMEVFTTQPGLQLYTANGLDGSLRAWGKVYQRHAAVCLEAQHFPDSPNRPDFPSTVLRPSEVYRQLTVHTFRIEERTA